MKKIGSAIADYFRHVDKSLLLLWLMASAVSIMFLHSIIFHGLLPSGSSVAQTQFFASLIGLIAAVVISLIDYHLLLKLWKLYLPFCVLLVGLTFTSLARVRGGNQAWLDIALGSFSVSLQPSELLKICFITTFAMHLNKVREQLNRLPNILLLCAHAGGYVLLIQLQGDSGSALIFVGIFLIMIFLAGIHWKYVLAAVGALAVAIPVLWFKVLNEDQKMRILVLSNPELDLDRAWQQNEAFKALVFGGMRGNGVFNAEHTYVYVSDMYNDFIFSFIGETTGFIGCLGILLLLLAIAFKILYDSRCAGDAVGKYICIGVFAMIVVQMIINIGMCIGVLPVIGVTLPLLSAGGSSVLAMYLGLGLVLSVYRHSRTKLFSD